MTYTIHSGDCIQSMQNMNAQSVHCCVTSPPYFGLRDYGQSGQIGLEKTPDAYVSRLVEVFREVRRVLRDEGTLWLNLGDSYGEAKQLLGIPWRVAFALQADGWCLRQDIIWHKPNPMPESVRDRCTKAHEYIFLLSKSERYYFDAEAMKEPAEDSTIQRAKYGYRHAFKSQFVGSPTDSRNKEGKKYEAGAFGSPTKNKRSVWKVATKPYKGAHFATYPPDLIRPCVLAGCPASGTVLDPFGGSGTTAQVAIQEGRNAVLCELNPEYVELSHKRLSQILI